MSQKDLNIDYTWPADFPEDIPEKEFKAEDIFEDFNELFFYFRHFK